MAATSETDRLGTVRRASDGRCVLRFRRRLGFPVERVWAALTEPAQLRGWWGEATVELVEGGRFSLRWLNTDDDGNSFVMDATITELRPPYLLQTQAAEHGVLRWELTADGAGTVLDFSSTVELPAEIVDRVLAGWHWHLDALATVLGGGSNDLVGNPGWAAIHQRYLAHQP